MSGRPLRATVVVTTCDRPDVAARAVESALAQTEPRVEVLVIDDGVRDHVPQDLGDERVRVIRTRGRIGVSRARNVGLAEASTPWITFLDDDDELVPTMVEDSLAAAVGSDLPRPVAVVTGMEEIEPDGTAVLRRRPVPMEKGRHYFLENLSVRDRRGLASYNTLFAPVEMLRDIGGFDEEMPAWMHLDLMLRLNPICSIEAVPEVGYRMFHHEEERLSQKHRLRADAMVRTHEKHRDIFRQHPEMEAHHLGRTGIMYLRAGAWGKAIALTTRSLLRAPRRPGAVKQLLFALAGPRVMGWWEDRKVRKQGKVYAPRELVDGSTDHR